MPGTPDQKIPAECLAQGSDPAGGEERFPLAILTQETLSAGGKERGRNAVFSLLLPPRPSVGQGPRVRGPGPHPWPARRLAPAEVGGAGERSVRS